MTKNFDFKIEQVANDPTTAGWHTFVMNNKVEIDAFIEMIYWAKNNLSGNFSTCKRKFLFEDGEDCLAFTLAWSSAKGEESSEQEREGELAWAAKPSSETLSDVQQGGKASRSEK